MVADRTRDGNGLTNNAPLKPLFYLPVKIRRSYDTNWKPITEMLEQEA